MAEENVIKTNIVANSDMSGLISDLNKVSSSLAKLQQQLNASNKNLAVQISAMNRTFAETLRSTGQFSTHFVSLTSDVDKFGQQLDRGQLKLSQFFRVYGQHTKTTGGLIRDLAKQQVQLQNAVMQPMGRNAEGLMQYYVHIPRGLDEIKSKSAIARQELAIMNKVVQEGANQLINWGKNTQWAGRQLTVGLTVPMVAFGKAASDAFRTADQELVRLTKVYGGLAATSSTELKKVRQDVTATAAELAKGYGASFTETLGLAADIAATGKQGNELLGSIKETTRLAVLGEVDRQEAMKATLAIQTAFKQNTQELSESINFLNAVENQTSTTLQDLVEAIPKAGPIIKGLGGSVQDLALYLTAMREGGVSAAEGANALKSALGALINPTQVATKMFAGFGIDLKGIVQRNAGDVTGTILALQEALDKLNPLQKQQALEQLFGKFQFARMNALFSNLGKQGSQTLEVLDLMKASSQDLANIAGRELAQVTESASGKYRRALEGLKADLAGVGEQFLTISTTLINIVDGVIKFANNLPKPIKQLLSVLGMFTATAGPIIMLTGVLGNFFGYIIKGVYHFKALFKGAEGWKLLTPEILAASRAGDMAEQTFYSDARAAAILKQALDGLIGSYSALEARVSSGVIPLAPSFLTAAREVNPQHPLLSPKDTRSMSHLNPVSGMTAEQKAGQTFFGVVPGAPLVNQKIGGAPQIYMETDLPMVPGVTSVGGVSTGVVAEEAAKWHAMTAALAMQSKADITKLKTEVAATGLVTTELSTAYDALLPQMTELTRKAAAASAEIVAEVRAGKITVDQARARILALNAEIEAMMVSAATSTATQLGRNIDVTKVPLLQQPVVDVKTGKTNMKELLKPGRTRGLLTRIAEILGVKTFGAPYSIETTRPKKFNVGGYITGTRGHYGNVYNPDQHGAIVPGPNVNYDIIPSNVPLGGFVLNQAASRANPDLVALASQGYSGGGQTTPAILTPGETVVDPSTYSMYKSEFDTANATRMSLGGRVRRSKKNYGSVYEDISFLNKLERAHISDNLSGHVLLLPAKINKAIRANDNGMFGGEIARIIRLMMAGNVDPNSLMIEAGVTLGADRTQAAKRTGVALQKLLEVLESPENIGRVFGGSKDPMGFEKLAHSIYKDALRGVRIDSTKAGGTFNLYSALSKIFTKRAEGRLTLDKAIKLGLISDKDPTGSKTLGQLVKRKDGRKSWVGQGKTIGATGPSWAKGKNLFTLLTTVNGVENALKIISKAKGKRFNDGGPIPGYAAGGVLTKAGVLKRLGAMFSVNPGGRGYSIDALPMKPNLYMFKDLPISNKAKKYLYDALVSDVSQRSGQTFGQVQTGPITQFGRMSKTVRGFGHADQLNIWQWAARSLRNNPNITSSDREFFDTVIATGQKMPLSVGKKVLGLNRGGQVGGRISRGRKNYGILGFAARNILPMGAGLAAQTTMSKSDNPIMQNPIVQFAAFMGIQAAASKALGGFGQTAEDAAVKTGKFGRVMQSLNFAGKAIPGWGKAAAVALTAVAAVSFGAWEKARKARLASQEALMVNQDQAKQLGITYKSAVENIKEATKKALEQRKLLEVKAAGAAQVGGGISLTVAEFEKLKKTVKETQPDIIEMFNTMSREDVVQNAANLKAQLVAAGKSAKEAGENIFAAMSLSNKSDMATKAVTSSDFMAIIDKASAATHAIQTFNAAIKTGADTDKKEIAASFETSLTSIDAYYNSISKIKDANGKLIYDNKAIAKTVEAMSKTEAGRQAIGQNQYETLVKQNPELENILNKSDSIVDAWAKYKLYTEGIQADLSQISGVDAQKMLQVMESVKAAAINITSKDLSANNPFLALVKSGNAANAAAKKAKALSDAASKNAQKNADAEIKAIDKKIKKINDEYEARRKLIELQSEKESYAVSLQKEQLNYQDALAAGDMSAAAQARLNIRQLNLEYQKQQALAALEEKRNKDLAAAEKEKEKVQERIAKLQERAAKLAEAAAKAQQRANSIAAIQQSIAMTLAAGAITTDSAKLKQLTQAYKSDVMALAKLDKAAAEALTPPSTVQTVTEIMGQKINTTVPGDWSSVFGKNLTYTLDKATTEAYKQFGMDVEAFGTYVSKLTGTKDIGSAKTADLSTLAGKTTGTGKDKKFYNAAGNVVTEQQYNVMPKAPASGTAYKVPLAANSKTRTAIFTSAQQLIDQFEIDSGGKSSITSSDGYVFDQNGTVKKGGKVVGRWYDVSPNGNYYKAYARGGMIKHFGPGGDVMGPGTSTSDSIPAYLSNGEYVIRASSVEKYGKDLFEGLNAQKFKDGGPSGRIKSDKKFNTIASLGSSILSHSPFGTMMGIMSVLGSFIGTDGKKTDLSGIKNPEVFAPAYKTMLEMGLHPFKEIAANSGTKGDYLNAALTFAGFGLTKGIAGGVSKFSPTLPKLAKAGATLTPYQRSFAMAQIDSEAIDAVRKIPLNDLEKMIGNDPTSSIFGLVTSSQRGLKILKEHPEVLKNHMEDPITGSADIVKKHELALTFLQTLRDKELIANSPKIKEIWSKALADAAERYKNSSFKIGPGETDVYGNPITESSQIASIARTIMNEGKNRSIYNKEYAKMFYGITDDAEVGVFKGVGHIDPAKSYMGRNEGWKTSSGIGTFFTTHPYVAKRFGETLPAWVGNSVNKPQMFGFPMKISDLPSPLNSSLDYNAEWTQFFTPDVLRSVVESGKIKPFNWSEDIIPKLAMGGMISPNFNIPTPKPNIVNPSVMGYNNGGSVHRYDVGGLVVNAAPGQNEREIASMVVNMLETKNLIAAAKSGRGRTI